VPVTEAPGTLGAGFAPDQWAAYVLDNLAAASVVLASGATEVRTANKAVHLPRFTGNGSVGWYGELDPISEGAPPGDELVLTPRKCASLCTLSNEVVSDSNADVLDAVGSKMVRGVALEVDRAIFVGTGAANDQPTGILTLAGLPNHDAAPDYAGIVGASGLVRAAGGAPNIVYVNPTDYTALQLATDANDRPLIGTTEGGMAATVAGMVVWPTPAVPAGTALVAQADQIVVAVREDASVAVSDQAGFTNDATLARVVARVDVGVNDLDGLATCKDVVAG
jgi:HK97 family phage major capsid protein